jgi:hypothetical protein
LKKPTTNKLRKKKLKCNNKTPGANAHDDDDDETFK